MRLTPAVIVITFCVLAFESSAATTTKSTKKTASQSSAPHTRGTARRKGHSRKSGGTHRVARQLAPTPDRYKEIQKALADRGYLKTQPNGVWDSASQDAMRAFQSDRKLDPTGKLTAASLIALGLGPKQDTDVAHAPATSTNAPAAAAPQTTDPPTPQP